MKQRHLLIACLSFSLTGCFASSSDYPATWSPAVTAADGCHAAEGTYADGGKTVAEEGAESWASISLVLFGEQYSVADRVTLTLEPGPVLRARAFEGTAQTRELVFSAVDGKLECSADGAAIRLYSGKTRGKGNPVAGYEHKSLLLRKAADGALIVRSEGTTVGLVFLLIPVGVDWSNWMYFPAAQKPTQPSGAAPAELLSSPLLAQSATH